MIDSVSKLRQDLDEVTRRLNAMEGTGTATALGAESPIDFQPITPAPANPPAANQIRNGDYSHSINTWHESVTAPGTDKVLECAWWFSNDTPAAGQALDLATDARTNSVNKTLKAPGHTQYNAAYCDWGLPEGIARLTGTKSLDAPFPGNSVYPKRTMYFAAIVARRNNTIVIPEDCRLAAMLYNNDPAVKDFMQSGDVFHLDGQVRGAPAATTERRYKVLAETDRGYSFLSDELILAAAPTDGSFISGEVDVYLTWSEISGVLRYKVYRHNVVAGTYDLLKEITSGSNTYGDNNHVETAGVGGYPAATHDRVICYVATPTDELSRVGVNGVIAKWPTVYLNIPVPSPLASSGSGYQVLRVALTKALDRQMTDAISTAASTSVESASAEFTALDTGRTATLKDADGNVLHGPEAITYVDATHVTFATAVGTSNADATLYIEEGGDHGLLMDMAHIGYLERAAYAPYFEDLNRGLPATAAPNTSTQGGIGPPGNDGDPGGGGLGGCVEVSTPVAVLFGNRFVSVRFRDLIRAQMVRSGNHYPNFICDIPPTSETDDLQILRTANGMELPCSLGQVVFASFTDTHGVQVSRLKAGDYVLTCNQGRDECSPLIERIATGKRAQVGTIALTPGHKYLAGRRVPLRWWQRLWQRLHPRRLRDAPPSGIYCHNLKYEPPHDLGL